MAGLGIGIDTSTIRRVDLKVRRFSVWVFSGVAYGSSVVAQPQVCVQLRDRDGAMVLTSRCIPTLQADVPGNLMVVMSGGSAGAPGFKPGQALVAGVVPSGVGYVELLMRGSRRKYVVKDSGFLAVTNDVIRGIVFKGRETYKAQALDACQDC